MRRIIYDGDSFYELDEECMKKKKEKERETEQQKSGDRSRKNRQKN